MNRRARILLLLVFAAVTMGSRPSSAEERTNETASAPVAPLPARAPDIAERLAASEAKLDQQGRQLADQLVEIKQLRRDLDAERATRRVAEEEDRSGRRALFRHGRWAVAMSGFLHADGVLYDQSSEDELDPATRQPLNQTRFVISRARLRIDADYGIASSVLEFDGNTVHGATARVLAAEVSVRWPGPAGAPPRIQAVLGLQRIPFGFEVLQTDYDRILLDRSTVIRALFPGQYDLGISVRGGIRWLRYALAVMNGNPAEDRQYAAVDPTKSKDVVGRAGVETLIASRVGLRGGVSASWGTGLSPGLPASKSGLQWIDSNADGQVAPSELAGVPPRSAIASRTFTRWALGGDLLFNYNVPRLGVLTLYGELIWASNYDRAVQPSDPVRAGRDLRQLGWYVGTTQELTRYVAVGLRYDRYAPDADATDRQGAQLVPRDTTYSTWAVALAGCVPPFVRFTLEYDHNQNALGRDAGGQPTTLRADVVTLRGQARF